MDRLRSTLPTATDALPADLKVTPGFRMPKLSPRRFSPRVKRNANILKMLRKPKPNWKNMLKGRKSEGSDNGRLSTIDQGDEEEETAGSEPVGSSSHDEGERLASHHSMTPGLLSQGRDLHVNVSFPHPAICSCDCQCSCLGWVVEAPDLASHATFTAHKRADPSIYCIARHALAQSDCPRVAYQGGLRLNR